MAFSDKERQEAVLSCRYCPMCHHANLITSLTRRETYSARGRGLTLFAIEKGKIGWDESVADVMYKFAADGLARHVCAGHINHDEMVIDGRRKLVKAGTAPIAVATVRQNLEKAGNPWGEKEPDLAQLTGAKPQGDTLVYFGPAARIKRQGAVKAFAALLKKAGTPFSFLSDEGDSGLLLYQLGENDAAHAAARALQGRIEKAGAKTVVVLDADAYRTLKAGFGDYAGLGKGAKVRHASEVLAELAKGGKLKFKAPGKKIAYHDPCALARFAPCIDPPRALAKAVADAPPLEIGIWSRENANCSGECGGLPFTNPDLAKAAAVRRLGEAKNGGAELVVAGGPASTAALDGNGLPVKDLVELAADCLVG